MKTINYYTVILSLLFFYVGPVFSKPGTSTKAPIQSIPKENTQPTVAEESAKPEPKIEEKKTATRGYYIGLGPAGLWNLNSSGIAYYVNGGYTFDLNTVAMKIGGEFFGRSGAIGFVGSLGVSYFPNFLNSKDVDPFLGFDMGYGTARLNESGGTLGQWIPAMVIGPSLGVQLFRTADVNLELALKWGFFLASGSLGSPSYSLLKLSFFFH